MCVIFSHYIFHVPSPQFFKLFVPLHLNLEFFKKFSTAINPTEFLILIRVYSISRISSWFFCKSSVYIYIFKFLGDIFKFSFSPQQKEYLFTTKNFSELISVISNFCLFSDTMICLILCLDYVKCVLGKVFEKFL